jgi:hypothetical protein
MTFTAGAAKIEITPPLGFYLAARFRTQGAQRVADPLFAKALVLSQEDHKIAILTADVVGFPDEFVQYVKQLVHEKVNIPPAHLLISATHTHSGPSFEPPQEGVKADFSPEYVDHLAEKMAAVVQQADQARVDARVGWGSGDGKDLLYNRRTKRPDGRIVMSFEMPTPEVAETLHFGPVDPEIGIVRFEGGTGEPIATLINFGIHNVCTTDLYAISADIAGRVAQVVEGAHGGICLFTVGAAGNAVPIERGEDAREKIGNAIGEEALKVSAEMRFRVPDRLQVISERMDLPLCKLPPLGLMKFMAKAGKKILPKKNERISMILNMVEGAVEYFSPYKDQTTKSVEIKLIRIGTLNLVGLEGEYFAETGLEIKAGLMVGDTFVITLCNGLLGYVPTTAAWEEKGGFEQNLALLAKGSAETIRDLVLTLATQEESP